MLCDLQVEKENYVRLLVGEMKPGFWPELPMIKLVKELREIDQVLRDLMVFINMPALVAELPIIPISGPTSLTPR